MEGRSSTSSKTDLIICPKVLKKIRCLSFNFDASSCQGLFITVFLFQKFQSGVVPILQRLDNKQQK